MPVKASKLNELKKEISFHYKPQTCNEREAVMVGYIDNRDVQDLLDDIVGPENWSVDYHILKDQMFARVGIFIDYEDGTPPQWVYKCDTGTEANMEEEKSQVSDSMKRAAVQWGCGRFLYRLGMIKLPTKDYKGKFKPATDDGKILWTNDEISDYIKNRKAGRNKAQPAKPETPTLSVDQSSAQNYAKPAAEPKYNNPFKAETMKKINSLVKGELKGKECIKANLDAYNKAKGTTYKLADLNTDEKITAIIDFINNIPPAV